jgi:hypothetical protein
MAHDRELNCTADSPASGGGLMQMLCILITGRAIRFVKRARLTFHQFQSALGSGVGTFMSGRAALRALIKQASG